MPVKQDAEPAFTEWDEVVPIKKVGQHTDVYLTETIETPWEYNKLCYLLEHAYDSETFTLHINNYGGYVDSGFMIYNAIKASKAAVTAKLSGTVASVSTIITLACDELVIGDHTSWLIHNYTSGAQGKGGELKAQVEFTTTQLNKSFRKIYKGFLTETEMANVIEDKDMWMGKKEVLERWKKFKSLK